MNGSDGDDWPVCCSPRCRTTQTHAKDTTYDRPRFTGVTYLGDWYCDACWAVLKGDRRIAELEADVRELKRKAAWAKWLLGNSWLARIVKRILHGGGYEARLEEGLKTILAHAGSAIECCDEPGAGYLRDVCEIVDQTFGIDTSHEQEDDEADYA